MQKNVVVLERRFVPKGTLIIEEGDVGRCAYLIQFGRVQVFTNSGGQEIELGRLGTGDIFGEMAVLAKVKRAASVRALRDCNLIVITSRDFERKLEDSDSTVRAVVKMLIKRLLHVNESLGENKVNVLNFPSAVQDAYENLLNNMPEQHKAKFEEEVGSRFADFLDAAEQFKTHMVDDSE